MKRKIAALAAAVMVLQCMLPVCTGPSSAPGIGKISRAAETEYMTERIGEEDSEQITEQITEQISERDTVAELSEASETDEKETEDPDSFSEDSNLYEQETIASESELTQTENQESERSTEENISSSESDKEPVTEKTDTSDTEQTESQNTEPIESESETISDKQTDVNEMQTEELQNEPVESEETLDLDENLLLSANKDRWNLEVSRSDHSSFDTDTVLQLRSLLDLAEGEEYPEEAVELYRSMLLEPLCQQLTEEYMEQHMDVEYEEDLLPYLYEAAEETILTFEPLEVQFLYTDGSSYEPGEITLCATIEDRNLCDRYSRAESFVVPVWYDGELRIRIPAVSSFDVSVKEDEIKVSLSEVYRPSFFAVAEIDRVKAQQLLETAVSIKDAAQPETETEESEEAASDYAYTAPGTPCKASSAFTKVTKGSRTFSSAYTFLRGNSNSVCTFWYDSSLVTKGYQEGTGMEYLIPKSGDARGKFGFRITNVGYSISARCNLDLYVTVTKYKTYSLDKNGNKVNNVYPFIHMNKDLTVYYQEGLPDFELQYEIVKSGTNERVPGNYRFMWTDIDGAQRYGFVPLDGSLDARYCLTTSTVNCGTETMFNQSYHMIYGQEESAVYTDDNYSVMFETSGMSSFKIFVGQTGNGSAAYQYASTLIKNRYADAADGVYNYTARSKLGWDGYAYGPTALPSPLIKYVSNDAAAWNSSNTLPSVTSEYWYAFELYVPQETAEYYYSQFQITDVLPAGVDYIGNFSARKTETGELVGYFTAGNNGDTLTVSATAGAMSDVGFYGYTYHIQFQVKMDPTEISASYSGTTAVYTVQNQATQKGKHKADAGVTTTVSNIVTTSASETRPSEATPMKKILTSSGAVEETTLSSRKDAVSFEVQQVIPTLTNAWRLSSFTIQDTLEACFSLERVSVYLNQNLQGQWTPSESGSTKAGWTFTQNGRQVQMTAAGGLSGDYYGNTVRLVLDVRIKEGSDLSAYVVSGTPELRDITIPNRASTVFQWQHGTPASVTRQTNQVLVKLKEQLQTMSRIVLTKAISAEDIVWAHGNPTFTFCVEGTDMGGTHHRYYDTVEFTPEHTPSHGIVTQSVGFEIPSGTYRAYETNVIRYRLSGIDGIQNGQAAGVGVNFSITAQKHGAATFHNRKTTDGNLSDTAFIRNTIIP